MDRHNLNQWWLQSKKKKKMKKKIYVCVDVDWGCEEIVRVRAFTDPDRARILSGGDEILEVELDAISEEDRKKVLLEAERELEEARRKVEEAHDNMLKKEDLVGRLKT